MKILDILRPSRKKVIILVVLIVISLLAYNFFGSKEQTPLQFTEVKRQDIKSTVSSSGTLTGKNSVTHTCY